MKETFSVGAYNVHTAYHMYVCDFKAFYIICEDMVNAPGYFVEFLDMRNWTYKRHYTILTESSLLGRLEGATKYYPGRRSTKNERQAHSTIVVSNPIKCI